MRGAQQLIDINRALFHRESPELQKLNDRVARDARQDRTGERRRHNGAVDLEEDVHRADFLDVLAMDTVEPKHLRKAFVLGSVLRADRRGVIAAGFGRTCAAAHRAHVIGLNQNAHRIHAFRIIRADR